MSQWGSAARDGERGPSDDPELPEAGPPKARRDIRVPFAGAGIDGAVGLQKETASRLPSLDCRARDARNGCEYAPGLTRTYGPSQEGGAESLSDMARAWSCIAVCRRSPSRHSIVAVLPAPLGPTIPKISPSSTPNERSSTTIAFPYVLFLSG